VVESVKFEQIFSFKFSPRPGTPAVQMEGHVPDEVKTERMSRLLDLQKRIMAELSARYRGTVQEILVEEMRGKDVLIGRTTTNRWAELKGDRDMLGKIVKVSVERATPFNLFCKALEVVR